MTTSILHDDFVHVDEVKEVVDELEERIETIESDHRYPGDPDEFESAQVNAYLALMQWEWHGELKGLKQVRNELEGLS